MTPETIHLFDPATLSELDEKNLLSNRRDIKYVFPNRFTRDVLMACLTNYNVLDINGIRTFGYHTTYFDTSDLHLYNEHHRGKLSRAKVRLRKYLDSNQSFVELKIKNNKDKTIKSRVAGDRIAVAADMILEQAGISTEALMESMTIQYKRITLVHKTKNEKLTLDFEMLMKHNESEVGFPELCFAEVKTEARQRTDFCMIMKQLKIREGSMSKYCLGIVRLYPEVRKSNFKLSLGRIQKTRAHEAV